MAGPIQRGFWRLLVFDGGYKLYCGESRFLLLHADLEWQLVRGRGI